MALVLKSTATSNSTAVTLPTGIVAGDLLVIVVGTYNNAPVQPTGWSTLTSTTGSGSYIEYGFVFYKVAVGTESSTAISVGGAGGGYEGVFALVFSGADMDAPIMAGSSLGANTTTIAAPALTTTKRGQRFSFFTQMSDSGTEPVFTGPGTGWTTLLDITAASYHMARLSSTNVVEAAGSFSAPSISSTQNGGNVGIHFVVYEDTWTYGSEVSSSTQSGSTSALTVAGNYEIQVKTSDAVGYSPWSATKAFVVSPPSNLYVCSGGVWKLALNNSRISGAWKQLPSTKKNTGGTF